MINDIIKPFENKEKVFSKHLKLMIEAISGVNHAVSYEIAKKMAQNGNNEQKITKYFSSDPKKRTIFDVINSSFSLILSM